MSKATVDCLSVRERERERERECCRIVVVGSQPSVGWLTSTSEDPQYTGRPPATPWPAR